ncbi:MAG: hypothetical protein ACFE9S_10420 [Candidatus Hermodarchaeota archaeon]
MESKTKKLLILEILLVSIGIILVSVPFPANKTIFERENSTILSGNFYITHTQYPWRSYNQLVDIDIETINGSFTLLVLDETGLSDWIALLPFSAIYETENVTDVKTSFTIEPPYLGQLHFIIIANTTINYSALIKLYYWNYLTNWGIFSLGVGLVPLIYFIILKKRKKKHKNSISSNQE